MYEATLYRSDVKSLTGHDIDDIYTRITGTHLVGLINANFAELVKVFGAPTFHDHHDKSQVEWVVNTPMGIATIYDYKDWQAPQNITVWHIGGHDQTVAEYVQDYFDKFVK